MSSNIRICLEKDGCVYKISSITLLSDGSFKLDVPYCQFKEAFLTKITPNYKSPTKRYLVKISEKNFTLRSRPQLSIHSSGFVQFSGPGVLSGVDKKTGIPKGLGVYSAPLSTPVQSGPTAGISFWGLEFFEKLLSKRKTDLIINEGQLINRFYKDESSLNSYLFEFFVFSEKFDKYIRKTSRGEEATIWFPQYPGLFTFPVLRLKNHSSFIGVIPFMVYSGFAEKVDFGFNFGGPAGTDTPDGKGGLSSVMAFSEKYIFDSDESLDYKI